MAKNRAAECVTIDPSTKRYLGLSVGPSEASPVVLLLAHWHPFNLKPLLIDLPSSLLSFLLDFFSTQKPMVTSVPPWDNTLLS